MMSAFGVDHGDYIEKAAAPKGVRAGLKAGYKQGAAHWETGTTQHGKEMARTRGTSYRIGSAIGRNPTATGAAGGAAIGSAAGGGLNEGIRRFRNKRSGVKVSVKDQYTHPYKSNAKWTNAREAKKG